MPTRFAFLPTLARVGKKGFFADSRGFHTMLGLLFDTKIHLNPFKSLSKLPSHDSDLKVLAMCLDIYQKVPVDASIGITMLLKGIGLVLRIIWPNI